MRTVTCIEDLRQTARRKVPRAFFDYAEAGSYSEATLRANCEDLARIKLRQRVLVDVSQRDLATTIMGEKVSLPLALAPIGLCGMQHGDGEILACRAAQAAGIPFTLSTMSICSIEDVARHVFDRADRHGGKRERHARRLRRPAGQNLAVAMLHAAEPDRCERERKRDLLAHDCGGEIALRYVDQHALAQLDALEVLAVGAQRRL